MPRKPKGRTGGGPKAYWAKLSPEQRSKEMRRRMKIRRQHEQNGDAHYGKVSEVQLAYISGRVEEVIQSFARSQRVSYAELAERLGKLLAGSPRG